MNRIQQLRKETGMKQTDLAAELAVSRQAVSKWETGAIDLSTDQIARCCRVFNVTADYLLGLSTQRTAQISDDDAEILAAYKRAPDSIRAGIDALLEPYKAKKEAEGL